MGLITIEGAGQGGDGHQPGQVPRLALPQGQKAVCVLNVNSLFPPGSGWLMIGRELLWMEGKQGKYSCASQLSELGGWCLPHGCAVRACGREN